MNSPGRRSARSAGTVGVDAAARPRAAFAQDCRCEVRTARPMFDAARMADGTRSHFAITHSVEHGDGRGRARGASGIGLASSAVDR